MKAGDLVRWIGFPGSTLPPSKTGPVALGIIVKVWTSSYNEHNQRIDVLWGGGRLGKGLYPQTIEIVRSMT